MAANELFTEILKKATALGASDIHISAGTPIRIRVKGRMDALPDAALTPQQTLSIALTILYQAGRIPPGGSDEAARTMRDEDCAYSVPGVGRFRANICRQRGSASVVLRAIAMTIPTVEELGLPTIVKTIAQEERGLVLVTGATGSGKSTTLAAIVAHINATRACKIVCIEDPIEFVYRDGVASILQREVGSDTDDFTRAMRAALRQDPDVILVGEMRDRETIDIALKAAETGHLLLSTVHTPDAPKTLNRIISFFDVAEQQMIRIRLADSMRAIISQRLLPRADGAGRIPAVEIMRATTSVVDCILNSEKTHNIPDYIRAGREHYGMQSFDQHLMALFEAGTITLEVAKAAASSPADFERNLLYV